MVHVHNIQWGLHDYGAPVKAADVNLYVTPFTETNPLGKKDRITDHRVQEFQYGQNKFNKQQVLKMM